MEDKGPLVRIELSPGRYVKMYEADAIAQGLMKAPKQKSRAPAEDKMRRPAEDKAGEQGSRGAGDSPDDFTAITGVGPATARALQARGLRTFEDLRQADLSSLPVTVTVIKAIEKWKRHG